VAYRSLLQVNYWLLISMVSYKASHTLRPSYNLLCCHLSSNHYRFIHQSSLLWLQQRHLVANGGETGREMTAEFCLSVSLSYLEGSLTCRKILRHGADAFTSHPKKIVPRTSFALKNPSFSAGFEPANFGSNGKHDITITLPRSSAVSATFIFIEEGS
jgi:hypothetical protein